MDSRAWWKSCQICASRSTGALTRPASRLNATQLADREPALDDELRAEIEQGGGDQLADELDALAGGVAEAEHAEARGDIGRKLFLPALLHLRLDRHRLERLDPGDALDQERLVLGAAGELLVETLLEQRRRRRRDADIDRNRRQHDRGQQRRIDEHHRDEHEGEEQVDDQRQPGAGEKVADVLQLADARHRIADATRLEIGDRQRQQMPEQPRPKLHVDSVGGVREQIGAQDAEHRLEHGDGDESHHQHIERSSCSGAPAPCRSPPGRTAATPAPRAGGRTRRPAPRPAGAGTCGSRRRTR